MYDALKKVTQQLTGPGGPFEVHQVEVNGVPLRAYAGAPASLRDVWLSTAGHGDKDYLIYEDQRLTFAQSHARVAAIANAMVERFGVRPGDRVAIAMRNYPEWTLAYWATVSIGATVVGMNAWWTGAEMQYAIEDSTPKLLIADRERLERFGEIANRPDLAVVSVRCDEAPVFQTVETTAWTELADSTATLPVAQIDPESDACIFYTSGTTGKPKGAQLTHRGCTNNIMSLVFWNMAVPMALQEAGRKDPSEDKGPEAAPCFLVVTPLFHVTACNCVMHGATLLGAKVVHMYKWDTLRALELIQSERVTTLSGVPVMSRELLAHPRFGDFDTSSLKSLGGGGAAIQPDLVHKIDDQVKNARPGTGYGMTEACGVISMSSADFFVDKPESAGPLLPVFEGKVVDADGNELPSGQAGELCVRGAQVIKGYLNRDDATAETIVDGWLHTGDIAIIDADGFVTIVDRAKDMVLRGGENVYCAEVEAAFFEHPDVAECAVFGVADDRLGEEVGAAIVVKDGATLSGDALRDFARERIAGFKIPRYIWLQTELLPRNASGKFLKRELRETLQTADAQ